jgi:hypothetical protein
MLSERSVGFFYRVADLEYFGWRIWSILGGGFEAFWVVDLKHFGWRVCEHCQWRF